MIPIYQLPFTENPSSVEGITYSVVEDGFHPTTSIGTWYWLSDAPTEEERILYLRLTFAYDMAELCKLLAHVLTHITCMMTLGNSVNACANS